MNKLRFLDRRAVLAIISIVVLTSGCGKPEATAGTDSPVDRQTAGTPTPVPAVPLTPGKVHAGKGLDTISLGQGKEQVIKALGKPEEEDANEFAPGQTYALYYTQGIELSYTKDKLEVITLHSPSDKWKAYTGATEQNLGVGSNAEEIIKALGEPAPDASRALRYPKLGLWFRLDSDREKGAAARAETLQIMKPE